MKEFKKAWLLAQPNIFKAVISKGLWISYLFFIVLSVLFMWDTKNNVLVHTITSQQFKFEDEKTAFLSIFYEYYFYWWVVLMFIFILPKLLFSLTKSFSVSETLWLKFNQTSNITLVISRILFVIAYVGFVLLISIFWGGGFSLYYDLPIEPIIVPIIGLLSHILFSAGMTMLLCSYHKLSSEIGILLTFIALLVPVFLQLFKSKFRQLGDYFPHSMPLMLNETLPSTEAAYLCSIILGLILMTLYFIKNYFKLLKS